MTAIGVDRAESSFAGQGVVAYFALAFGLSWAGVLILVTPTGIPATPAELERMFPLVYLAMLVGPSVGGLLVTAGLQGKAGLRELVHRLAIWRVGAWAAVALLTAPAIAALIQLLLVALSASVSRAYIPPVVDSQDRASALLFGVLVGLGAGIFEELGWTGVATPALRRRHGVVQTGLIVGALWGAWHFLVNFWGSGAADGSFDGERLFTALLFSVSVLPLYRVLMVWVYERTRSLSFAMLMHASLTTSSILIAPSGAGAGLVHAMALAAAYCATVAAVWATLQSRSTIRSAASD